MCVASHHLKQACITWPATPSPTTASPQSTTTRHRLAQMTSLAQALSDHRFRDQRQPFLSRFRDQRLPIFRKTSSKAQCTTTRHRLAQMMSLAQALSDHRFRDQRQRFLSTGPGTKESAEKAGDRTGWKAARGMPPPPRLPLKWMKTPSNSSQARERPQPSRCSRKGEVCRRLAWRVQRRAKNVI